jgi:hypothetical protein
MAALPAEAETLRGDAFITAMDGNTLSGKDDQGVVYDLYFLPGGAATYQDANGKVRSGSWHLDNSGDVCVMWIQPVKKDDGCYRVSLEDGQATWSSKDGTHKGGLLGGVSEFSVKKKAQ